MDSKDLELCLCSDDPIFVGNVPIYPVSLKEIARIGYSEYNFGMRFICISEVEIKMISEESDNNGNIDVYEYVLASALSNAGLLNAVLRFLSILTHSQVALSKKTLSFVGSTFEINKGNFCEIQEIIRLRNGLKDIGEEDENPDNEAARRVLQRRKEERMKRKKAKQAEDGSEITIADLVSITASGLGLTFFDVMKYDLYQFNDQFNRLKIMDDYEVSVQALLHGAKKESVNLKHWITKINHDSE